MVGYRVFDVASFEFEISGTEKTSKTIMGIPSLQMLTVSGDANGSLKDALAYGFFGKEKLRGRAKHYWSCGLRSLNGRKDVPDVGISFRQQDVLVQIIYPGGRTPPDSQLEIISEAENAKDEASVLEFIQSKDISEWLKTNDWFYIFEWDGPDDLAADDPELGYLQEIIAYLYDQLPKVEVELRIGYPSRIFKTGLPENSLIGDHEIQAELARFRDSDVKGEISLQATRLPDGTYELIVEDIDGGMFGKSIKEFKLLSLNFTISC